MNHVRERKTRRSGLTSLSKDGIAASFGISLPLFDSVGCKIVKGAWGHHLTARKGQTSRRKYQLISKTLAGNLDDGVIVGIHFLGH